MKAAVLAAAAAPAAAAVLVTILPRRAAARAAIGAALVLVALAIAFAANVAANGTLSWPEAGVRVDALAAIELALAAVVLAVATAADVLGARDAPAAAAGGRRSRFRTRRPALLQVVAGAAVLSFLTDSVAGLWLGALGAVLACALLVRDESLAADSDGALAVGFLAAGALSAALVGLALLAAGARGAGPPPAGPAGWNAGEIPREALRLSGLSELAPRLEPRLAASGLALGLLGFGALAGLAPLHAWLPAATRTASAPVAAVVSVVLTNVGMHGLVRLRALAALARDGGGSPAADLLVALGAASLAVALPFLLLGTTARERLAYASVGHAGVAAFGFGIGGLAATAAVLQLVGHALAKTVALFALTPHPAGAGGGPGSASSPLATSTSRRDSDPPRGLPLGAMGVLALAGLPPAMLFTSTFAIAAEGFARGHALAASLVLLAAAAGLGSALLGSEGALPRDAALPVPLRAVLAGLALTLVVLGLALPPPVAVLLRGASRAVESAREAPSTFDERGPQ